MNIFRPLFEINKIVSFTMIEIINASKLVKTDVEVANETKSRISFVFNIVLFWFTF